MAHIHRSSEVYPKALFELLRPLQNLGEKDCFRSQVEVLGRRDVGFRVPFK